MELTLQPVLVAAGEDGEGRLAFQDDRLVAVLVRLSALHGDEAGWWFLEKGFGPLDGAQHPTFPDLDAATDWMKARLADHLPSNVWPQA